jgi:hypothetical protein
MHLERLRRQRSKRVVADLIAADRTLNFLGIVNLRFQGQWFFIFHFSSAPKLFQAGVDIGQLPRANGSVATRAAQVSHPTGYNSILEYFASRDW